MMESTGRLVWPLKRTNNKNFVIINCRLSSFRVGRKETVKNTSTKIVIMAGTPAVFCALVLALISCAGSPDAYRDIDAAVYRNDFEKGLGKSGRDRKVKIPYIPKGTPSHFFLTGGFLSITREITGNRRWICRRQNG